jgi:hypothetical protein
MNNYENILIYLIIFSIIILLANIYYMHDIHDNDKSIIKPKETIIQKNTRILEDIIKKNFPK